MGQVDIRVLDTRIGGRMRNPRSSDIIVRPNTPLDATIAQIAANAGGDSIRKLSIYAHGFEMMVHDEDAVMCYQGGGYGIQLGRDGINLGTVAKFSDLSDRFSPTSSVVEILACAAADVSPDQLGLSGNGRLLMAELAAYTNAIVRASDAVQSYSPGLYDAGNGTCYEAVDFGDWEGNVWLFSPADGSRTLDRANMRAR